MYRPSRAVHCTSANVSSPILSSVHLGGFFGVHYIAAKLDDSEHPKWPETVVSLPERGTPRSESMHIYENQLQRIAQNVFGASDVEAKTQGWDLGHRSMLAVIAFGANGESSYGERHDEIRLNQIIFTRGTMIDALGRTRILAVKTLWRNLHYIEPESDILTHSLYQIAGVNGEL